MGGIRIGVDVETGVKGDGDDGGMMLWIIKRGGLAMKPLLLLFIGENEPIRVLNRGVRIRGESKVVEGLRVSGTDEVEAEARGCSMQPVLQPSLSANLA